MEKIHVLNVVMHVAVALAQEKGSRLSVCELREGTNDASGRRMVHVRRLVRFWWGQQPDHLWQIGLFLDHILTMVLVGQVPCSVLV